MRNHRRRATTFAAVALIGLSLVLAGCGGDDDDSAADTESVATETSDGSAAGAAGSIPEGYSGVEADLPTAYDEPTMQSGTSCKIGFQNPVAANEFLGFVQKAVIAEAESLGCTVIALDDALSPDKQVSQHAAAARPERERDHLLSARSEGDHAGSAAGEDAERSRDRDRRELRQARDPVPLIATQVWQGRDIQAFLQVSALAEEKPDAKVGLIGIGIPVPALKYLTGRQQFYAEEDGLTVVGHAGQPVRRRHRRREGGECAAPAQPGHRLRDRLQRSLARSAP